MIGRRMHDPVAGEGALGHGRWASRREVLGGAARFAGGGAMALVVAGSGFGRAAAQEDDDEGADDAAADSVGGEDESAAESGSGGGGRSQAGGQTGGRRVTAVASTGTGAPSPEGEIGRALGLVAAVGAGAAVVGAWSRRPAPRSA